MPGSFFKERRNSFPCVFDVFNVERTILAHFYHDHGYVILLSVSKAHNLNPAGGPSMHHATNVGHMTRNPQRGYVSTCPFIRHEMRIFFARDVEYTKNTRSCSNLYFYAFLRLEISMKGEIF